MARLIDTKSTADVLDADFTSRQFRYSSPLEFPSKSPLDFFRTPSLSVSLPQGRASCTLAGEAPLFHDDPDDAKLFAKFTAPQVTYPSSFLVNAKSVHQVGYRSYLSADGRFFTDEAFVNLEEQGKFLKKISSDDFFLNEDTGLNRANGGDTFTLGQLDRPVQDIDSKVFSLCSHEPSNYGSFLLRVLPKLSGQQGLLKHRKVLAPNHNQSMRELLVMAGVEEGQLISHNPRVIYRLKDALIPSLRNTHLFLDQPTIEFYAGMRASFGSVQHGKKIFVSRLGWTQSYAAKHRVMLNEEELVGRLLKEGFEIVRPHAMTVREQIHAFSSASLVVGGAGSGMFNCVFCRPGTQVIDIESEPHWIFSHTNLFASCQLRYGIFEAKSVDSNWDVAHKPFSVNINALLSRINESGAEIN